MSEIIFFDPDSIRQALKTDIVAGLRCLADSIENGSVDGRFIKMEGVGSHRADHRAHMQVTLDIAAEVKRIVNVSEYKELT